MKTIFILASVLIYLVGCNGPASTTADMMAYDAIAESARQVQIGVNAYDGSVQAEQKKLRDQIVTALGQDVEAIAQKQMTPDAAAALKARVILSMTQHMDNLALQDQRRRDLYEPIMDNLTYIEQLCEQGRQFALYKSDIATQWRTYIETSTRSRINPIIAPTGAPK